MKKIFWLLLSCLFCAACSTLMPRTPMPQFNYEAEIPLTNESGLKFIQNFSRDLELNTDLKVGGVLKDSSSGEYYLSLSNPLINVDLITNKNKLLITVSGYQKNFLGVSELSKTPEAEALAKKIEELWVQRYPGSKLEKYDRYRGFLGP